MARLFSFPGDSWEKSQAFNNLLHEQWDHYAEKAREGEKILQEMIDNPPTFATEKEIEKARQLYCDNDIMVDDGARTSCPDPEGVWVSAWVWVPGNQENEEKCDFCGHGLSMHFNGEGCHEMTDDGATCPCDCFEHKEG